jgi:hypothetical protein
MKYHSVTREGPTLFVQVGSGSPLRLEATAENKFQIDPPGVFFEFDSNKGEVTWKRGNAGRVFSRNK